MYEDNQTRIKRTIICSTKMEVWPTRAPHTWRAWVLSLRLTLSQCVSFRQADGSEASGILFPELSTSFPSPKVKLCHHSEQLWKCNRSKPQSANTSDSKVNSDGQHCRHFRLLWLRKHSTGFFQSQAGS